MKDIEMNDIELNESAAAEETNGMAADEAAKTEETSASVRCGLRQKACPLQKAPVPAILSAPQSTLTAALLLTGA